MNRLSAALLAFAVAYQVGIAHASPDLCSSVADACDRVVRLKDGKVID